jgi:hypothetical protein
MSVKITAKQLTALSRFNREYNVKDIELDTDGDGKLEVHATVHAGKELRHKGFYVDTEGSLAGVIKSENSSSDT